MFNKYVFFVSFFLLVSFDSDEIQAQQFGLNTQYVFNLLAINPAYSGSQKALVASTIYRRQWANLEGSPTTTSFNIHSPIKKTNSAFGFQLYHDQIGAFKTTGAYLSYAYRMRVTRKIGATLGLRFGADHIRSDLNSLNVTPDPNGNSDPVFTGVDDELFVPNFGLGLFISTKRFYLSISAPRIINNATSNTEGVTNEFLNHYYFATGMIFRLKGAVKIKPNILVRQVGNTPLSVDIGANVQFLNNLWVGPSYRSNKTWSFMINYEILRNLKLGYSFDIPTGQVKQITGVSHEILLSFKIDKNPHYRNLVDPRDF